MNVYNLLAKPDVNEMYWGKEDTSLHWEINLKHPMIQRRISSSAERSSSKKYIIKEYIYNA